MLLPCHLHCFRNFGCAPTVAAHLPRPLSLLPLLLLSAFDHLINKFMKLLPRHTLAALEPQNELIFLSCCSFSASSCKQLSPHSSPLVPSACQYPVQYSLPLCSSASAAACLDSSIPSSCCCCCSYRICCCRKVLQLQLRCCLIFGGIEGGVKRQLKTQLVASCGGIIIDATSSSGTRHKWQWQAAPSCCCCCCCLPFKRHSKEQQVDQQQRSSSVRAEAAAAFE